MIRKLLLLVGLLISTVVLSGCTLPFKKTPAALQITTTPVADVFIDGKPMGKTPYSVGNLKAGEITIKLIPESTAASLVSWEGKVKLNAGVLTLIERDFAANETNSFGQILSLEKTKDNKSCVVSVISDPDEALVKINGEAKGFTPLTLEKISEGDYEILVSKEGFDERKVKAKTALGYKLIINVNLAQKASEAASLTPTPSVKVTPVVTQPVVRATPTESNLARPYVLIKETPTGWLRVRAEPSTTAKEIAKVYPNEKYSLIEEKSGWYKIRYSDDKEGWISGQYAEKFE